jgi:hypothetical protein
MRQVAFDARLATTGGRSVILRIPTVVVTFMMGAALLASACTSSSAHTSPTPSKSAAKSGFFQAGPDPCRLVTPQDILTALKERMVKASGSRSTCRYVNAPKTDDVSITTAKMTPRGAEQAVASTASTVKVKVRHLRGLGDIAIAYLTTTKTRSAATCLFAKNGTFVFLVVGSPHARLLTQEAVALAEKAASRT